MLPPPDSFTKEAFAVIRRSLLAGAVAMLVVPALAGCEAGFNAPTLQFHNAGGGTYWPTPGATDVAATSGIRISDAFEIGRASCRERV